MNLSVKGKMQNFLTDQEEIKQTKVPDVNIKYLNLVDELCKLMDSCDPKVFTDKCAGLMASEIHNIPLFSDKVLKNLGEYHNVSIMLRYLMCYFTWYDLSVIQQLLETCGYSDGVKLLKKFHLIFRSFTEHVIPTPHPLMIPSDASPYTIMATQYELEHSPLSLRDIEAAKSLITEIGEMTPLCCQFLAINVDHQIFYWLIPKNVTPVIVRKVQENCIYLHNNGVKDMFIFPNSGSFFTDNKKFSVFSANAHVDEVSADSL